MDSHDLFKRLTTNLAFSSQKSTAKPKDERKSLLLVEEKHEVVQSEPAVNGKRKHSSKENDEVEEEEITIVGNLTSKDLASKPKSKKQKTVKKMHQIHVESVNHLRNMHHINVNGDDIPEPVESFERLFERFPDVSEKLRKNILSYNFPEPTPIQMQAMPVMMKNRDILASAQTGSGKTIAFLFPILCNLKQHEKKGFRALVLAPTRELVRQTYLECCRLAEGTGIKAYTINNPGKVIKNSASLKKFDILITTPNRLVFMLNQEKAPFKLDSVEWLVIDEADKLFEDGKQSFREQLSAIYKACDSPYVKHAMFSATYTHEVEQWSKLELNNVIQVSIGRKNVATYSVEQQLLYVGTETGKLFTIRELFKKGFDPPILVFVQSKERAQDLFKELIYDGINVDMIHSERTQQQRDNTIRAFRQGKIWVLICTELMGRGIDFKGVNLVVNYDFPLSAISYIHRIGRTGRAGKVGKAVTFFTDDDSLYLKSIANVMREAGCEIPSFMLELKNPSKRVKTKLKKSAPKRDQIARSFRKRYKNPKDNNKGDNKQAEKQKEPSSQHVVEKDTKKKKKTSPGDEIKKKIKTKKSPVNGAAKKTPKTKRNKK